MFHKFIVILVFVVALGGPARAHWCQGPTSHSGISQCNEVPSQWVQCGTFSDGNPIYAQTCSGKKHAKNSNHTKVVLISVGVGAVFLGAMWYFFKKRPSENNPGQVTLMTF